MKEGEFEEFDGGKREDSLDQKINQEDLLIDAKSFFNSHRKEIGASAKKGAKIMENCILNPKECDCSLAPTYAVKFCEHKKELQIKCIDEDYDACMILEQEPNLPEGMPEFSKGMFESIADGARKAQEGIVKGNAARKVGNMILECMDNSSKCDCSFTPKGNWKTFCEHKTKLVIQCKDKKHYDSCFKLDEEPIFTEDMPGFIKSYLEKNTLPKIEEKKQKIFNEMKIGTDCENVATIKECKAVLG